MNCADVELSQFSSKNSPQMHIAVSQSSKVHLTQLTITAPGDSPNTDGIHASHSHHVRILNTTIGTGHDCISLGPGTSDMLMRDIKCGPGHGIRCHLQLPVHHTLYFVCL